jgi:flagellar motor switch protein FliG
LAGKPFDFLEHARIESLVPYLSREHGQTVAVVLSYLAPARAAKVLAALPERLQADAIERLADLGDTDPDTLQVLEQELADWVSRQQAMRTRGTGRTDAVAAILAAADHQSRGSILANLLKHNRKLAQQFAPTQTETKPEATRHEAPAPVVRPLPAIQPPPPLPRIHFDDLMRLDNSALAAVLRVVDAEILVLALAGASDELVARITDEMPRPTAKAFRQRLCRLGPTRLRDVEAAQQEVAAVAARIIHARRAERRSLIA